MFETGLAGAEDVRVFVSYDREHDGDLHTLLADHASARTSGFRIAARSPAEAPVGPSDEGQRRMIREADEVIVICGEHTDCSVRVAAELQIAQEEKRPYFLLWGRRERMCTMPSTARSGDCMYSWTREIVQNQIVMALRPPLSPARPGERKPHFRK